MQRSYFAEGRAKLSFSSSPVSCLTLAFFYSSSILLHPTNLSRSSSFSSLLQDWCFYLYVIPLGLLLVFCDVLFLTPQRRNVFSLVYNRRP